MNRLFPDRTPASMTTPDPTDLTHLLRGLAEGKDEMREKVLPLVYERLHEVAQRAFRNEGPGHTMQPTVLVHDAWMKLAENDRGIWQNRAQFFAVGATVMRRILVDHARARQREKRGGDAQRVSMVAEDIASPTTGADVLELDSVLQKLKAIDERQHAIVELRFFSGLTVVEVAECLGVSRRTVEAEWTMVKAWLHRELEAERNA